MFPAGQCPLCYQQARLYQDINARVECARCGHFRITRLLYITTLRPDCITGETKDLLPYLSAHTRQSWERGEEIFLNNDNWKAFAQSHANIPESKKLERLLGLMAARSKPGLAAKFDDKTDPPLVDAERAQQLSWMLGNLVKNGYATRAGKWLYALEPKGWEKVQGSGVAGGPEASRHATHKQVLARQVGGQYVDPARIEELKSLKTASFDLSKLIRACEELNTCFAEGCYLAVAMLVRSVLDHVPPIFGRKSFPEVASNYSGARSFKASMSHLESSSRKIADSHLHQQIRKVKPCRTELR